jgi:hypothetical protein
MKTKTTIPNNIDPKLTVLTEITPNPRIIVLTKEARRALKFRGPSDHRLEEIVNGFDRPATLVEIRQLAAQLLISEGYILE